MPALATAGETHDFDVNANTDAGPVLYSGTVKAIAAPAPPVVSAPASGAGGTTIDVTPGSGQGLLLDLSVTPVSSPGLAVPATPGCEASSISANIPDGGAIPAIGKSCSLAPGDYTATAHMYDAAGKVTISTRQFNVPAPTAKLIVAGPSSVVAGAAGTFTITAQDATGHKTPAYRGTVRFTSTDAAATLPADYTFTEGDAGVRTVSVTLRTAGTRSITATDTATSTIKGSQSVIVVNPAAASTLVVSGFPTPDVSGVAHSLTVTARDPYGNTATGYTGTVRLSSSDPAAVLPANAKLTAGVGTFSVTLRTAGTRSITATDTASSSIKGSQSVIVVNPAAAATLVVSGFPTPEVSGVAHSLTVTARDPYGNTATGYRGKVHFTSTDTAATLPADYTFTAGDAGVRTFSVTLKTAGTRSVTATDTATSSIKGSQSGIVVTAAPAVGTTFRANSPARILDTRPTAGVVVNIGLSGAFKAGIVRTFKVAGANYVGGGTLVAAVPSWATAVTGNLTVVGETASGVVAIGPTMTATGAVTTINFNKGDIRANNVTVGLGPGGTLQAVFRSSIATATTQLIFDVTGYFTPGTSGATYHVVAPGRVLDSRPTTSAHKNIGLAGTFKNKTVRTVTVAGVKALGWTSALVPANATAVTGNLTVTASTSDGYVAIGPTMVSVPATSTLNTMKGQNRANGVTVALSGGKLQAVWVGKAGSTADVIFDVTGYFTPDATGLMYYPITPVRDLDSSTGNGLSGSFLTKTARTLTVGGLGGVPTDAKGISGNLTLIKPGSAGYGFIAPTISGTPASSTLNSTTGLTVANGFDVALSVGKLSIIWMGTTGSKANFSLDVTGYWK